MKYVQQATVSQRGHLTMDDEAFCGREQDKGLVHMTYHDINVGTRRYIEKTELN